MSIDRQMDKEGTVYVYTIEYYAAIQNGVRACHLKQHRWTRGYYAKWNKSVREREISYDFIQMCNLRKKQMNIGEGKKKIKQDEIREGDKP